MFLRPFNILIKPVSARCNIRCDYCYYLSKESNDTNEYKMNDAVLRHLLKKYIAENPLNEINFIWQGGEPLLAGLSFYKKVIEYQNLYNDKNKKINNILQTNAMLINDKWSNFFKSHNFLIGVSLDGPQWLHDHYRKNKSNVGSFEQVLRGLRRLQAKAVDFNILCTVNNINALYPAEVYDFFVTELQVSNIQFIPVLETSGALHTKFLHNELLCNSQISHFSVAARDYANFINSIFDIWAGRDIGKVFIQMFENVFSVLYGLAPALCTMRDSCGDNVIVERNGDVYCCDHYVYENYKLGNITENTFREMINSRRNSHFSLMKSTVASACLDCDYLAMCYGGCPKHRIINHNGESVNYFCSAYKSIFRHLSAYVDHRLKKATANVIFYG